MSKLDEFKSFVATKPELSSYVKNGQMTWQKFYELYDMYGEDSNIWDEFKVIPEKKNSPTISDIVNMAKNIDINKLQDGVNSLSKAVGLFSELFTGNNSSADTYKPRAVYKRFED